jgi:hypothetical protein
MLNVEIAREVAWPLFTELPEMFVLRNPPSPGPQHQVLPDRTPLHRTGCERYSQSFREGYL